MMNETEFASKIRTKYPGVYDGIGDKELASKVVAKYPQYESQVQIGPDVSKFESALRGGAQGLSLGSADEGSAAIRAVKDYLLNKFEQGESGYGDIYRRLRDESREKDRLAREANPKTFMGSQVAGAILPAAAATIGTKGAALPAVAGRLGAMGVAEGLGHSEADLTKGEIGQGAQDAALGGLVGLATPVVAKGAGTVAKNLFKKGADAAGSVADVQASKALGLTGAQRGKVGEATARRIGREALDDDIVRPFASDEAMLTQLQRTRGDAGRTIGRVESMIDEAGAVKPQGARPLADLMRSISRFEGTEGGKPIANQFKKALVDLEAFNEQPSVEGLQNLKNIYGQLARPKGALATESKAGYEEALHAITREIDRTVAKGAKELGDPSLYDDFVRSKRQYHLLGRGEEALEKKIVSETGKKSVGLTDLMVGGGIGLGTMNPVAGLAAVGGKKLLEANGPQVTATTARGLQRMLEETPNIFGSFTPVLQRAAERGVQHLITTNYVLQQQSPEYRKQLDYIDGYNQ